MSLTEKQFKPNGYFSSGGLLLFSLKVLCNLTAQPDRPVCAPTQSEKCLADDWQVHGGPVENNAYVTAWTSERGGGRGGGGGGAPVGPLSLANWPMIDNQFSLLIQAWRPQARTAPHKSTGGSVWGGRWSWSFPCGQTPNRPHNSFNSKRPLWWPAPLPPVKGRSVCAVPQWCHSSYFFRISGFFISPVWKWN